MRRFLQVRLWKLEQAHPMPADQARWDVYGKMDAENARYLWGILDEASKAGANRSANEQKIGDWFGACTNKPEVEKAGRAPLAEGLARIEALQSVHDIAAYIAAEHKCGIDQNVPFNFDAAPDLDNSSQMLAYLGAAGLGLADRDYYVKTDNQ